MVIDANDRHLVAMMAATIFSGVPDIADTTEAVEVAIDILDCVDVALGKLIKENSARKAVREGK